MKLFKDVKIVFPPGKGFHSLLFYLFPILSLFGQSEINNFGASKFVKTYSGYSRFELLDYNKDGIEDLFLFGNQNKNFILHKGQENLKFSDPIWKFFFFPIDDIKWLTKNKQGDDYYIFVSRNRRLAGLVSFTKSFSLQLLNTVNFNSYPSNIVLTDFDSNGVNEALIYGNNFDGIILLRNEGYRLIPDTLYKEGVFSDLISFDFNQDQIDDIIAVDALNNTINFLENTEIGGFFSTRTIERDQTLYSIGMSHLNEDAFSDLIISKNGGLEILFGDSVFSYQENVKMDLSFTPTSFLISDVNSNSFKDLISLNENENGISIVYDFFEDKFVVDYPFQGVSDLRLDSRNLTKRLYMLSKNGKLQIIGKDLNWGEDFQLTVGGRAGELKSLVSEKLKNRQILVKDVDENIVKLLNFNSRGTLKSVGNISLKNDFQEFTHSKNLEFISGFTGGNRLIEVTAKDLSTNNYKSFSYVYSKYPVENIIFDEKNDLKVLSKTNNLLYYESLENLDESYVSENINFVDSMSIAQAIMNDEMIYFWTMEKGNLTLKGYTNEEKTAILKIDVIDSLDYRGIIIPDQNDKSQKAFSIINNGENQYIHLIENQKVIEYISDYDFLSDKEVSFNKYKFYSGLDNGNKLFVYNSEAQKIGQFNIDSNKRKLIREKEFSGIKSNDYMFGEYYDHQYLVYSNNENYCITFKVLDK